MKKPLLYPKLAWQGIRKNAETYLPYLLIDRKSTRLNSSHIL